MKEYACSKCGSTDVFIDQRGVQQALCCGDCGAWLKWISKKELPLVKRYIENNKTDDIDFTGETEPIKSNVVVEDGQIRIWNYKAGKVEYYEVNEKVIDKISKLLKSKEWF